MLRMESIYGQLKNSKKLVKHFKTTSRMSADTVLIQDALGEKVTNGLGIIEKIQNKFIFSKCII